MLTKQFKKKWINNKPCQHSRPSSRVFVNKRPLLQILRQETATDKDSTQVLASKFVQLPRSGLKLRQHKQINLKIFFIIFFLRRKLAWKQHGPINTHQYIIGRTSFPSSLLKDFL